MLRNIQHASGNRPLKGPTLGSADKYATLLPLAWPIKLAVSQLQIFLYKANFCWILIGYWLSLKWKKWDTILLFVVFEQKKLLMKNLPMENQLSDQVCWQEFCKCYPNIHHISHLTLKLNTSNKERGFCDIFVFATFNSCVSDIFWL